MRNPFLEWIFSAWYPWVFSQFVSESAPRFLATTSQASPSVARSCSQSIRIWWVSFFPTRMGGLDQIKSNFISFSRASRKASCALCTRTLLAPLALAFRWVRSKERLFTSIAQISAFGDSNPKVVAMTPHPHPRSRKRPEVGGWGALSRRTFVPGSKREAEKTWSATCISRFNPEAVISRVFISLGVAGETSEK